eukprot:3670514-Pleurochrysis_carterae.AAC.2
MPLEVNSMRSACLSHWPQTARFRLFVSGVVAAPFGGAAAASLGAPSLVGAAWSSPFGRCVQRNADGGNRV